MFHTDSQRNMREPCITVWVSEKMREAAGKNERDLGNVPLALARGSRCCCCPALRHTTAGRWIVRKET